MTIQAGPQVWLEATLTVDTSAYASGDHIGKAAAGNGVASNPVAITLPTDWAYPCAILVQNVMLVDEAKQNAAIDVLFYNQNPSATTFTDNSATDVADADMEKVAGAVSLTTYFSLNDNSFAQATNCGVEVVMKAGTLYVSLVSRGTPTYAAADDLRLKVGVIKL
jgi:hypothetical protein